MKTETQKKRQQTGLRIVVRKGVHDDVRKATLKFTSWLRKKTNFPVRLTVYMFSEEFIQSTSGEYFLGMFFVPDDKQCHPVIHLATGDFDTLKKKRGDVLKIV